MPDINKDLLLRHIAKSDLTALEKRYLEGLVKAPPRKHGEWERLVSYEPPYNWFSCSVCRCNKQIYSLNKPKFCEYCGAEMDGGDTDETEKQKDMRQL